MEETPVNFTNDDKIASVPHWKIIPGRIRFLYDGHFHTSRNWFAIPFVLALMIIPFAFHWSFDGVYLIRNVNVAFPIFGSWFFIVGLASYIVCAFTDPGFLPRADAYEAHETEKKKQHNCRHVRNLLPESSA